MSERLDGIAWKREPKITILSPQESINSSGINLQTDNKKYNSFLDTDRSGIRGKTPPNVNFSVNIFNNAAFN